MAMTGTIDDNLRYMDTKVSWYRGQFDEIKKLSLSSGIETKNEKMLGLMEFVNLELAEDQTLVADLMFSGASGAFLKKIEIYSKLLDDLSYRMKFYTDTRIRGV